MRTVKQLMSLQGRTALVVGGGGHLGSVVASALAEVGATIALADKESDAVSKAAAAIANASGARVSQHVVELANEAEVRDLPLAVAGTHGGVDIVVNCAAFVGTSNLEGWAVPFEQQSAQTWRLAVEVNLTSAFVLAQASLPFLRASRNGSIVNVSSIYGSLGPDWSLYKGTGMANPAAYGASKGGLEQLTRWLATTLGPDVRVNCLSPGGIARSQPSAFVERYIERTPMRRLAIEEDFKGIVVFLASDLSAYVTGQVIMVDGGWGAW